MRKVAMNELENLTSQQKDELLVANGYLVREGSDKDGCEKGTWWNDVSYQLINDDDEVIHTICHDYLLQEREDDEPVILKEKWWEEQIEEESDEESEKLNAQQLRKRLVGKRFSFMELDDFMMGNGYVSEGGNGIGEHIQNDENVVYMADDTEEYEVQIFFEVLESDEERSDIFTLKVTNVEEF